MSTALFYTDLVITRVVSLDKMAVDFRRTWVPYALFILAIDVIIHSLYPNRTSSDTTSFGLDIITVYFFPSMILSYVVPWMFFI